MPDLRTAIKDAMKVSKQSVDYSKGKPAEHCGICVYYNKGNTCDKVQGVIQSDYWCRLFHARQ